MIKVLIITVSLLIILYNYRKKRLVSSSSMWVFCYDMIFVLYPIYESDYSFEHANLIDLFAFSGVILFFFGMVVGERVRVVINRTRGERLLFPNYRIANIAFWVLFFVAIIALYLKIGNSGFVGILRGKLTSKQLVLSSTSSLSIYSIAVHLLIPCVLTMWMTSSNRRQRFVSCLCLLIYIFFTIAFGFTRIFMISVLGMLFFYSVRHKEQKVQIRYIVYGLLALVALMVFMNFIRTFGLRSERSFANIITIDYIFESTDFSASYYWFDRLLSVEPPYINIIVYLKQILAFIPRSIWPSKPEPLSLQVLNILDPIRAASGYSTAGNSVLGEGYAILGYLGIFLAPFIWGAVCSRFDINYYHRLSIGADHCLQNIIYYIFAVFIVISGQRGDWSQYMTIVLYFYIIPLYLLSKISIRSQKGRIDVYND